MSNNGFSDKAAFIWSVADLLRGPYRPNQYKDVMLPLTVLRRLDCVLEPTKQKVLSEYQLWKDKGKGILEAKLTKITGFPFYNTSKFTFEKLRGDATNIAANLVNFPSDTKTFFKFSLPPTPRPALPAWSRTTHA
jgi:type I restriction enzyme M protein